MRLQPHVIDMGFVSDTFTPGVNGYKADNYAQCGNENEHYYYYIFRVHRQCFGTGA